MSQKKNERKTRRHEFDLFGIDLRKVYPLPEDDAFEELLRMLDRVPPPDPKE